MTSIICSDEIYNQAIELGTAEELREFLQTNVKLFTARVFIILQWTWKHREASEQTGIYWENNGTDFTSNSQILGDFLKIKSNSVNTNFRTHGFKIIETITTKIYNKKNWVTRHHPHYQFSQLSTISQVQMIPTKIQQVKSEFDNLNPNENKETISIHKINCTDLNQFALYPNMPTQSIFSNSILPLQVLLLINQDQDALSNTIKVYSSMKKSIYTKPILEEAHKQWIQITDKVYASISDVVNFIVNDYENVVILEKLKSAINKILQVYSNNDTKIYFHSFIKFVAQFGFVPACCTNIEDILSNEENSVFAKWFSLFPSDQIIEDSPDSTYFLKPSSKIGMFKLQIIRNKKVIRRDIDFNPCVCNNKGIFAVIDPSMGLISDESLKNLLSKLNNSNMK